MKRCLRLFRGFVLCSLSHLLGGSINTLFAVKREIDEDFRSELDRPIPILSVSAVLGERAQLPCDISTIEKDDDVSMVLWFRDFDGEPLYSFDLRNKHYLSAKTWSSMTVFKDRATFVAKTQPALLVINAVTMEDEIVYRCRVDFQNSPTRNSKVNLTIIEPPDLPVISDDKGRDRSKFLDPFIEGDEIVLDCEVTGGKPVPRINWFLEEEAMPGEFVSRSSKVTIKRLVIPSISRDYQNKNLSCHASNTNLIPPAIKYITLDINLKPRTVNISSKEEYLSASRLYNLECRCYGSKPPALITWWIGSRQIKNQNAKSVITESNLNDISTISFTPGAEDDGKSLTCRAENPSIENSFIEDNWRLNVLYAPILSLKIGSSLIAENIKENDDVYFECYIRANPKINKFGWLHNGEKITSNISGNVIKTDPNLILQQIKKTASGNFTCFAMNSEGPSYSKPVILDVKYSPVCNIRNDGKIGALKQETIFLKCDVDANPPPIEYSWTFNNSLDTKNIHDPRSYPLSSSPVFQFTPRSDIDFGTLSCKAKNEVGEQETACFFQIVAAGNPQPLVNCTMDNVADTFIQVRCYESYNGGLPQVFVMEVWKANEPQPTFNVTANEDTPIFRMRGIDPTIEYELRMYAVNQKGRSEAVVLRTSPLKGVAVYKEPYISFSFSSRTVILILLGICSSIATCVAFVANCRRRKDKIGRHIKDQRLHNDNPCHCAVLIADENVIPCCYEKRSSDDEPNPDIIPYDRERKVLKTFSEFPRTPPLKRHKKGPSPHVSEELSENKIEQNVCQNHCHLGNDSLATNRLLSLTTRRTSIYAADTVVLKPAHNHKLGPEVVTASHRLQESCI